MTFGEFIDDNGKFFATLACFGWLLALAFFIAALDTRDVASITACPQQEVKLVQAERTCDLGLMNDCLRIYRAVDKLSDCANNQYCEALK